MIFDEDDLKLKQEAAALRGVESLCCCPGVTVNECRRAYGLGDHPDLELGLMTLNLPHPCAD